MRQGVGGGTGKVFNESYELGGIFYSKETKFKWKKKIFQDLKTNEIPSK